MVKTLPISGIQGKVQNTINRIKTTTTINGTSSNITKNIPKETRAVSALFAGITISTFIQDFNQTLKENYFQLNRNTETGKLYEPDNFQKIAAANLYIGNDVLVTAPTGTGKTAIAEYVITKNLKEGKRTFYTTPLKALSNEKFLNFKKIYGEENVGLLTGDIKINPTAPIIIMTTEVYRNMAATELFNFDKNNPNKGVPKGLNTVIFDELQYLGDVDRGGIWEQAIMFTPKDIQILSLSATIGNNEEINSWIGKIKGSGLVEKTNVSSDNINLTDVKNNATVLVDVPSTQRHVPLNFEIEHYAAEISIPRGGTNKQKIQAKKEAARKSQTIMAKAREDSYKKLTKKLAEENKLPAIYFIFSKKECDHLLRHLSEESELLTTEDERNEIAKIIKKYLDNGVYLGEKLNTEALLKGYAVHNAGLLPSQKTLIEELFQKRLVKVVLATETLSAGINMPAKTTVISSPRKPASTTDGKDDNKRNLTSNEFHQMAGRAGRRGIDTVGYCYAISCNQEQSNKYQELINSQSNNLESNFDIDYSFIVNYLAEFNNEDELKYLLSKSLYTFDYDKKEVNNKKLEKLIDIYHTKRDILLTEKFIDENGKLTLKGELLKHLNGYEQIPIINIITNKELKNLNSKEIAGIIGGLANIKLDTKEDLPPKPIELRNIRNPKLESWAYKVSSATKNYNEKACGINAERELIFEPKAISHLYIWASLNEIEPESKKNWKEFFKGEYKYSVRDEGSLFKAINLTTDLLKQLIDASHYASAIANDATDKYYFSELEDKFRKALDLIQREPANSI